MQNPQSITIVGTGAVQPMSATAIGAKWIRVSANYANQAPINIGGPEVTVPTLSPATPGVGYPVNPGGATWNSINFGELFPPISELYSLYDLSQVNVGAVVGDILYVLYGG